MNIQPIAIIPVSSDSTYVPKQKIASRITRAVLFLVALVIAMPVLAGAQSLSRKAVYTPKIDRSVIENLQRWVNDGHDAWCKDAQPVASAEMRRIAPEFSGYQYDLAALPLESHSQAATRAVFTYHSLDGHTTYRITLRRYAWLKPLVNDTRSMIWIPAQTEVTIHE